MPAAVIRISSRGNAEVVTAYDADFVDDLKDLIPWHFRHWNRDQRVWVILEPYADVGVAICREHFSRVEVDDERTTIRANGNGNVFAALRLAVPQSCWPQWYRTLSKLAHPDTGGSNELMAALNAANAAKSRR